MKAGVRKEKDRYTKWILLHFLFWVVNFSLILHTYLKRPGHASIPLLLPRVLIIFVFEILCVYAILLVAVPYIRRQKYFLFALVSVLLLLVAAGTETVAMNTYFIAAIGRPLPLLTAAWIGMVYEMLPVALMFISPVLINEYYKQNERNKLLEMKRLETELQFLKGQVNPHFMFNTLNSIYILMRLRKEIAEEMILRFSTLLRYSLYECSNKSVFLDKEINFLDDYIILEKLKHSDFEIVFDKQGRFYSKKIAPFLLMPFLENAFKHISANEGFKRFIHVTLNVNGDNVYFECSNSYAEEDKSNPTGIGLENIKRRLELIYPGRHTLAISKKENVFKIALVLYDVQNDLHHH